jgi:diguanylate cyclase
MRLIDQLPCAVLVTSNGGIVLDLNEELLGLVGHHRERWLGASMDDMMPPASRIFLQTHVWPTLLRDGRVTEIHMQLKTESGERQPVLLNGRLGEHAGTAAYVWTLFLARERHKFEAELVAQRNRAESASTALEASQRFTQNVTDAIPGLVAYWDSELRCRFANQAHVSWFGRTPADLLGASLQQMLSHQVFEKIRPHIEAVLAGHEQHFDREVLRPDGKVGHLLVHCLPDCAEGQVRGFSVHASDVTELQALSAQLAQQHELMRITLQSISNAVITTDGSGRVNWLNPAAERMTGWSAAEAHGRPMLEVFQIVDEATREPTPDPVAICLAERRTVNLEDNTLLIARDGTEYGIQDSAAPMLGPRGDVLGVVMLFRDVSEQRRLSGELTHRATHDALTGLVNRAEFESRLLHALRQAQDEGTHHTLLYLDLDQFKPVNDACGHAEGDRLLQQVSKMLTQAVRGRDIVARLGGDEFAIILAHCGHEQALRVAQKICDEVHRFRFVHRGQLFRVGTSIGLVPVDQRWPNIDAILKTADNACYAAKEAGRNRVHAWFDSDAEMHARQGQLQWATRIQRALDNDGFLLHAQRIAPLQGSAPRLRAEVLLRMDNGDGTVTEPVTFLPVPERSHLASRIDRWMLNALVTRLRQSPSLDSIARLSMNLSGPSLGDSSFHDWAVDLLDEAGPLVCACLGLEINETLALAQLADATLFIKRVRQLGVHITLDEFGTAASSFGYLKGLPADVLKIERQFVVNLLQDPLNIAAVRCFVDVAHLVGLSTVAEGVEREDVRLRLLELGVNSAQGTLIHGPVPLDHLLSPTMAARD